MSGIVDYKQIVGSQFRFSYGLFNVFLGRIVRLIPETHRPYFCKSRGTGIAGLEIGLEFVGLRLVLHERRNLCIIEPCLYSLYGCRYGILYPLLEVGHNGIQ